MVAWRDWEPGIDPGDECRRTGKERQAGLGEACGSTVALGGDVQTLMWVEVIGCSSQSLSLPDPLGSLIEDRRRGDGNTLRCEDNLVLSPGILERLGGGDGRGRYWSASRSGDW
jgi:hypothetical protein